MTLHLLTTRQLRVIDFPDKFSFCLGFKSLRIFSHLLHLHVILELLLLTIF